MYKVRIYCHLLSSPVPISARHLLDNVDIGQRSDRYTLDRGALFRYSISRAIARGVGRIVLATERVPLRDPSIIEIFKLSPSLTLISSLEVDRVNPGRNSIGWILRTLRSWRYGGCSPAVVQLPKLKRAYTLRMNASPRITSRNCDDKSWAWKVVMQTVLFDPSAKSPV